MKISGKPSLIKKINKNVVLNTIREKITISRTELSKITGISKPTMSNIIRSLKKDRLIIKAGIGPSAVGGSRRPILYSFNKNYGYVIGSQIRVNEIVTILTNFNADIKCKVVVKIGSSRDEKSVVSKLFKSFRFVLEDVGVDEKDLKGIGIGMHGVVDYKKGILFFAPHFPEWRKNINFAEVVQNKFGASTYIDNYCRMQVCAEKLFGLGEKYSNIVAIETGAGLAAGIIIKGDIYRGNTIAGEIGHTTINPDGPRCFCGCRGCFEVMVSSNTLKESIKKNVLNHKGSILYKKFGNKIDQIKLKDIFKAYVLGDKFAEGKMNEIEYWFAIGIANTILSYDPEIVIIQGDYVGATDKFVKRIEEKISRNIFPYLGVKPNIKLSKLGKYVGPIGSVSLVLSQKINFSTVWSN